MQIEFPDALTFNRLCLCYAVIQTFDTNALKTYVLLNILILDSF